jgi:acyl-CoA dehydrogenase
VSDQHELLVQTVARLLDSLRNQAELPFAQGWERIAELGIPGLMTAEESGGFGGGWRDLLAVQLEAGRKAAPFPIGETILATAACAASGLEPSEGLGVIALEGTGACDGSHFSGSCRNVPWGRHAQWILAMSEDGRWWRIETAKGSTSCAHNLAGEPRDTLVFTDVSCEPCETSAHLSLGRHECAALLRVGQIAGALEASLALTSEHVSSRVQFGKVLGRFQVVQQQLAIFASEATAADCAARAACRSAEVNDSTSGAAYAIAAAKLRANIAIGIATAIAHQLHGAIGFTIEHPLQRLTRRLWAWRTEAGNDRFWAARLGSQVIQRGAGRAWEDLVRA